MGLKVDSSVDGVGAFVAFDHESGPRYKSLDALSLDILDPGQLRVRFSVILLALLTLIILILFLFLLLHVADAIPAGSY